MTKFLKFLFFVTIFDTTNSYATTWDEPWADKVIKEASSFVLGKVISTDPEKGIKVFILKTVSGNILSDTILISNFYALTICSNSGGHGAEFQTIPIDSCNFFVNQNKKGEFCIATPTTGFDYVKDGSVSATFRQSYHQASIPFDIYTKAMKAVFNNYHNLPYDKLYIEKFDVENLSKSPVGFDENEINTFFLQHVALECVYHLKLNIKETLVLPFLNDKKNLHNQISGARAMAAFNTETDKKQLQRAISDTTKRDFVKVMCVWSLSSFKPTELKAQIQKLEKSSLKESDGFGGNIMDPRVCTHFPSLKDALKELVDVL